MKKRKGFTLIELLAVIVILGVLMTIAVPNTLKMLERNKKKSFIDDSKKFISMVKYEVVKNKRIELPREDYQVTIINLAYLNSNDLSVSPYGLNYNRAQSFVAITYNNGLYEYYATLLACGEGKESIYYPCAPAQTVKYVEFVTGTSLDKNGSHTLVKEANGGGNYLIKGAAGDKYVQVTPLLIKMLNKEIKNQTGRNSTINESPDSIANTSSSGPIRRYIK